MQKFAIPCIISLLGGALYNIVDQIFIANADYLDSYGNDANIVVFPLTVAALAVTVIIGNGCCAKQGSLYLSAIAGPPMDFHLSFDSARGRLRCRPCPAAASLVRSGWHSLLDAAGGYFGLCDFTDRHCPDHVDAEPAHD